MSIGESRHSRRLWLMMAMLAVFGALAAVRAVDGPPTSVGMRSAASTPGQPRLVDRLRRWIAGPRQSAANASAVRHFDAFEFWALERDERRPRE